MEFLFSSLESRSGSEDTTTTIRGVCNPSLTPQNRNSIDCVCLLSAIPGLCVASALHHGSVATKALNHGNQAILALQGIGLPPVPNEQDEYGRR